MSVAGSIAADFQLVGGPSLPAIAAPVVPPGATIRATEPA